MRHRIVSNTGFGNPEPIELNNKGILDQDFAAEALDTYFDQFDGFDFEVKSESTAIGIEPSYQYDPLLIILIDKDKSKSYIKRGKAFGAYGSKIVSKTSIYCNYKKKSKFVRFVDKWHAILYK